MNGCTAADKPRIAILLAVYEPRMDWLQEQLRSLDAQTYPNLMLYVRDDGSRTVSFERIEQCVQQNIHSFSYKVEQNEKNLGSNSTFERLTREAEGEYSPLEKCIPFMMYGFLKSCQFCRKSYARQMHCWFVRI